MGFEDWSLVRKRPESGSNFQFRISNFHNDSAFTLIELMLATVILIIIVFIISAVFHQSSIAWDGGLRKAEGNMTGRALLGLMARELSQAVADTNLLADIVHEGHDIMFKTLSGEHSTSKRVAREITYYFADNSLGRSISFGAADSLTSGDYAIWELGTNAIITTNVIDLTFYTSDGQSHDSDLPAWVRIRLGLARTEAVSVLKARSAGPNMNFGDSDDITN